MLIADQILSLSFASDRFVINQLNARLMISKSERSITRLHLLPLFSPVFRLASIRRYRWYHPEISCAPTPLLIDGHAVGDANINRRVVIRAYALCLAWKTIFHVDDNSCRPVRPLLCLALPLCPSLSSLALAGASLFLFLSFLFFSHSLYVASFLVRSFLSLACGFLRQCFSLSPRAETWVCLTDAKTNM